MRNGNSTEVLVTGADQRHGVSVIRSLGSRGVSVLAAGPSDTSIGFYSRYASARFVYPSPQKEPEQFVEALLAAIERYRVKIVMPVVEPTLVALNRYRERIEPYATLAMAPRESVDLSLSKERQVRLAEQLGIPVPKTVTPTSIEEAKDCLKSFTFPLVLKASVKPAGLPKVFGASCIGSWNRLERTLNPYFEHRVVPLIQELHVGNGIGCGVLMDRGRALCCYQYLRDRENPPTGGTPARYQSMALWQSVRDYSVRLLAAMNWHGIALVEWKRKLGTDDVVFLEVNGRFWASLPGAVHAGMDFPFWLYELFTGRSGTCTQEYRTGVASRYLRGDLSRLGTVLRSYPSISSVPLNSRWGETLAFLLDFFRRGIKSDIHSWLDPGPGLREACGIVSHYVARVRNRLRPKNYGPQKNESPGIPFSSRKSFRAGEFS